MKKYRVCVDYEYFTFNDGKEALTFAEAALEHSESDDREVTIKLIQETKDFIKDED